MGLEFDCFWGKEITRKQMFQGWQDPGQGGAPSDLEVWLDQVVVPSMI